jgi:hypothetical protein
MQGSKMGVHNGGPKWGSIMGVQNGGPYWAVHNGMGVHIGGPYLGSKIFTMHMQVKKLQNCSVFKL